MSDEIGKMVAAEVSVLQKHHQDTARFRGQEPNAAMKLNREQLLQSFGELTRAPHSTGAMNPSGQQPLRIACLGNPYPPSVTALRKLRPVYLSGMRLETHHRGRFVVVKTLSEPKQMASLLIAGEDGQGEVCAIALFTGKFIANVLRKGSFLVVKEPYFTLDTYGTVLLRVDHPSDIIRLDMDSRFLPPAMTTIPIPLFGPAERKDMGDAAFERDHWQVAIDSYTRGLGIKQYDHDLRRTLHLNRARAHFNLGRCELALQDAVAAIARGNVSEQIKEKNLQPLLLAGQAAYELGDFVSAKEYFSQGSEISPDPEHGSSQLRRIQERLAEQTTGQYDFVAMSKSVTNDRNVLDHASFVENTRVASAGYRGRGLFATRHLAPSDLIMVERAFFTVSDQDVHGDIHIITNIQGESPVCYRGRYTERLHAAIDKVLHNPKQAAQFLDLHDGGGFDKAPKVVDGVVSTDTFLVEAITRLNAFAVPATSPTRDDESDMTGIWLHAAHANHSCIPNADRSFIGNMMVVRATRHIGSGEEICMSYCDPDDPYPQRKQHLASYGFECDCPLCGIEDMIPAMLKKRAEVIDESNRFITTHMASTDPSRIPGTTILAAEQLLRQLEGTYPDTEYQNLPRLECIPLSYWLCLVGGTPEEKLQRTINAMRNHGYVIEMTTSNSVTIKRSSAVPLRPAIMITLLAIAASLQLGKTDVALELQKLRKEIYIVVHGCESGLEDLDSQFGV